MFKRGGKWAVWVSLLKESGTLEEFHARGPLRERRETLEEKLEELGIGPKELAVRTGKPEKTISNVIHGKSSITSDMAVLFEKVLGIPYHFWMNRQQQYDEAIARQKERERIEEAKGWEKRFPYAQMAKLGWVPPTRKPEEKIEAYFII